MPTSELEKAHGRTPDPQDEPSAEWGWHGRLPKGAMIGGWFVAIAMFGMLIGNQVGHVEDFYLVIVGILMIFLQVMVIRRRNRSWRR